MGVTRQERGAPTSSSSLFSLRLGKGVHGPSSSSRHPTFRSCSSIPSSFSSHRSPRPRSPSLSRCSTDSDGQLGDGRSTCGTRSNDGEEEMTSEEDDSEAEDYEAQHTRGRQHHRGTVKPMTMMGTTERKEGKAWAAPDHPTPTITPPLRSSSSSSSSSPSSSSSSPPLLVSVVHCQGGYRPLVESLQAKYGWTMTSPSNECRAQLVFTDIKRAGKASAYQTIEAARQRRLTRPHPSSLSCPRVNCFPGLSDCVTKSHLGRVLSFCQSLFPSEFGFFPVTFDLSLPSQLSLAREQLSHGRVLIVKPSRGSQGQGISIVQHFDQLQSLLHRHPRRPFIAQRYIEDPQLLDGHKFDCRVYVLIESLHPLKFHMFKDGLARVCTEPYQRPHSRNLQQPFIHLTNYSLNKNNATRFKQATEDTPPHTSSSSPTARLEDDSHKRSIKAALSQLSYQGSPVDVERFWSDVGQVVESTIGAMFPTLFGEYISHFPSAAHSPSLPSACFHLLGFDLLLDSSTKVWLLEVNSAPAMSTDSALDYRIKTSVMERMMHILGYANDVVGQHTSPSLRPSSRQVHMEEEDGPLTSRSSVSLSSTASRRSTHSSIGSLSSSSSSIRPLSSSSLRRALASSCSAPTRGCIVTDRSFTPRLPRPYTLPVVDSRELQYCTINPSSSSYHHLLLFSHPTLLTLYCNFIAGSSAGLSSSAFRRLLSLFFDPPLSSSASTTSPPRRHSPSSADLDLLYLTHTRATRTPLMSFDGFCQCLAHLALSSTRSTSANPPSVHGAWTSDEGRRWMELAGMRWKEGREAGGGGGRITRNEGEGKISDRSSLRSPPSCVHRTSSAGRTSRK